MSEKGPYIGVMQTNDIGLAIWTAEEFIDQGRHPVAKRVDFRVATEEHAQIEYELYLPRDEAFEPRGG